jgi:outer membrane protein OmpA-like peptidoglycan-associated protein
MPGRSQWFKSLALISIVTAVVGCATQPGTPKRAGHSNIASKASRDGIANESLNSLESVLRSRLVSTDAIVLAEPGLIRIRFAAAAVFSVDAAELSSDADEILQPLAEALMGAPATSVDVTTYTDGLDSGAHALGFTQQRADLIGSYLTQHGVASTRIRTRGEGQTRPITGNSEPEDRRANRRVEISISALSS